MGASFVKEKGTLEKKVNARFDYMPFILNALIIFILIFSYDIIKWWCIIDNNLVNMF